MSIPDTLACGYYAPPVCYHGKSVDEYCRACLREVLEDELLELLGEL